METLIKTDQQRKLDDLILQENLPQDAVKIDTNVEMKASTNLHSGVTEN